MSDTSVSRHTSITKSYPVVPQVVPVREQSQCPSLYSGGSTSIVASGYEEVPYRNPLVSPFTLNAKETESALAAQFMVVYMKMITTIIFSD